MDAAKLFLREKHHSVVLCPCIYVVIRYFTQHDNGVIPAFSPSFGLQIRISLLPLIAPDRAKRIRWKLCLKLSCARDALCELPAQRVSWLCGYPSWTPRSDIRGGDI